MKLMLGHAVVVVAVLVAVVVAMLVVDLLQRWVQRPNWREREQKEAGVSTMDC